MDRKVPVIGTLFFPPPEHAKLKGQLQGIITATVRKGAAWKMLCFQAFSLWSVVHLQQQEHYPLKAVAYSLSGDILYFTGIFYQHSNLNTALGLEAIYRMFIDGGRQEVRLDEHSSPIIVKNSKQVRSQRLCVCFGDNRSFSAAEALVNVKGEKLG